MHSSYICGVNFNNFTPDNLCNKIKNPVNYSIRLVKNKKRKKKTVKKTTTKKTEKAEKKTVEKKDNMDNTPKIEQKDNTKAKNKA